jgi:hypothetical protein
MMIAVTDHEMMIAVTTAEKRQHEMTIAEKTEQTTTRVSISKTYAAMTSALIVFLLWVSAYLPLTRCAA